MATLALPRLHLATDERRARTRLECDTIGWIFAQETFDNAGEIGICDVSKNGAAFRTFDEYERGDVYRIRIGRGPIELSKLFRIVHCTPSEGGMYIIGGAFV